MTNSADNPSLRSPSATPATAHRPRPTLLGCGPCRSAPTRSAASNSCSSSPTRLGQELRVLSFDVICTTHVLIPKLLANTFTATAKTTRLKPNDNRLCARVSRRMARLCTVTSETWEVMPITAEK